MISLAGAYAVKYFTDRKIGMVRWLNYNGAKLRERFPLETIKYIALAAVVLLVLIAVIAFVRNRSRLTAADVLAGVCMCGVTAYYAYATVVIVYEVTKCSFLLVPLIGLAALLLAVRNLTRIPALRNKENA